MTTPKVKLTTGLILVLIGIFIVILYVIWEYVEKRSITGLINHLIFENLPGHIIVFSLIPVFILLGYVYNKEVNLSRELRDAQSMLAQKERLAAIGQLASMIGHDLRNPLSGIKGASYYLRKHYGDKMDNESKNMLAVIDTSVAYSDEIIADLLDFAREFTLHKLFVTPKEVIQRALVTVPKPNDNIKITDETQSQPQISLDPDKINRVIINLITNAFQAMPNGGELKIRSDFNGNYLQLKIIDNGVGINNDVLKKLWAPLNTTKANGMGLGLCICKRIIQAHNGNIEVTSQVGKGTEFTISLPVK